ncbi:DUF4183 domain-containing protein [Paenibacillus mesophilus]|uniref:DUF4183 domain-containing protein n=1 Tax=Paenibacillus mesophilus TaxID=2582849 RepID=UPI00236747E2|nr:DUF4183 domain-containing protein [Paenibacillus mesophilus]
MPGEQGPTGPNGKRGLPGVQGPPGPLPKIIIIPKVGRYYFVPTIDLFFSVPVSIPVDQFTDDDEKSTADFPGIGPNSYHNLFINGILQGGNSYSVSSNTLTLKPDGGTIYAGTPITLEIIHFLAHVS